MEHFRSFFLPPQLDPRSSWFFSRQLLCDQPSELHLPSEFPDIVVHRAYEIDQIVKSDTLFRRHHSIQGKDRQLTVNDHTKYVCHTLRIHHGLATAMLLKHFDSNRQLLDHTINSRWFSCLVHIYPSSFWAIYPTDLNTIIHPNDLKVKLKICIKTQI
jgi:hypothetical protein